MLQMQVLCIFMFKGYHFVDARLSYKKVFFGQNILLIKSPLVQLFNDVTFYLHYWILYISRVN